MRPASLNKRLDVRVLVLTGEDFVVKLTEERHLTDSERAGQQLLNDYRAGALGALALEVPNGL